MFFAISSVRLIRGAITPSGVEVSVGFPTTSKVALGSLVPTPTWACEIIPKDKILRLSKVFFITN